MKSSLKTFWDEIAFCGIGRKAAERTLDAYPVLTALPACTVQGYDYEAAYAEVKKLIGEDKNGLKEFVYMSCRASALSDTYRAYGIGRDVFLATMEFLTRFFISDTQKSGFPCFRWGWWFLRQLSMREFRLGTLEYEMAETDGTKRIFIHIPSGVDLSDKAVDASLTQARAFFSQRFPSFANADYVCSSWMLSPALPALLPANSNIVRFGRRFEILEHDENSLAALDWIFPSSDIPTAELPAVTQLQRNAKTFLLQGGKIGWTLGKLRKKEQ